MAPSPVLTTPYYEMKPPQAQSLAAMKMRKLIEPKLKGAFTNVYMKKDIPIKIIKKEPEL